MNYKAHTICLVLLSSYIAPLMAGDNKSRIEVRAADFYHSSKLMREIYGDNGVSYQVEASSQLREHLMGWVNFAWFSDQGKSLGFEDPTHVRIPNLSIGIKFPYQVSPSLIPYVGIGPSLGRISLKNQSQCSPERISKLAIGGILKIGSYFNINEHVFINIFADYLYQPVHFETTVDLGGIQAGGGLGVRF